jgi:hypothetical protein
MNAIATFTNKVNIPRDECRKFFQNPRFTKILMNKMFEEHRFTFVKKHRQT